jgi:hypothetical protein
MFHALPVPSFTERKPTSRVGKGDDDSPTLRDPLSYVPKEGRSGGRTARAASSATLCLVAAAIPRLPAGTYWANVRGGT